MTQAAVLHLANAPDRWLSSEEKPWVRGLLGLAAMKRLEARYHPLFVASDSYVVVGHVIAAGEVDPMPRVDAAPRGKIPRIDPDSFPSSR